MVRLNKIYTRTGDDGTTGARHRRAPAEIRPAGRGLWHGRRDQRHDRAGAPAHRRRASRARRDAGAHPERPVRPRRRPLHARRGKPLRLRAAAHHRRPGRAARGARSTRSTPRCSRCSSFVLPGGIAGRRRPASGPHRQPARRAPDGASSRRRRARPSARRRCATSTGSPTSCSSPSRARQRQGRRATCSGCRARTADGGRHVPAAPRPASRSGTSRRAHVTGLILLVTTLVWLATWSGLIAGRRRPRGADRRRDPGRALSATRRCRPARPDPGAADAGHHHRSCTPACCTSSATCCSCRSSATMSRTRWAMPRFLVFYLACGAAGALPTPSWTRLASSR